MRQDFLQLIAVQDAEENHDESKAIIKDEELRTAKLISFFQDQLDWCDDDVERELLVARLKSLEERAEWIAALGTPTKSHEVSILIAELLERLRKLSVGIEEMRVRSPCARQLEILKLEKHRSELFLAALLRKGTSA